MESNISTLKLDLYFKVIAEQGKEQSNDARGQEQSTTTTLDGIKLITYSL